MKKKLNRKREILYTITIENKKREYGHTIF